MTWPSDGCGSVTSSSRRTSGPPNSLTRIAFIVVSLSFSSECLRVVARELFERYRLTTCDAAHVVCNFGGVTRGEDFVQTFERTDEPFGQARGERARAE